ncbi:hypothetical protein [Microbacterium sp. CIAB417]|uniref:hypothetical protein n=1 Tax=Microbacterium sp. CIAB417 TaxID=2860287 RepID=UPI001FAD8CE3|nr:hypothetical protein [Microbacterium sp. CIAB417]
MTEEAPADARSTRRWWWIAGAAAAAVAVILVIGFATGWGAGAPQPGGGATESPAPQQTADGSPEPSASQSPAPSDTDEPPADGARETAPPVALDESIEPVEDVRVSLSSIEAITGEASVPGEVAGPALEITVKVENLGESEALTNTLIVNVYYGDDATPANILVRPREELPLSVKAGASAEGVYAFSVPTDARGHVVVEVDLSLDVPVVLFEGAVS